MSKLNSKKIVIKCVKSAPGEGKSVMERIFGSDAWNETVNERCKMIVVIMKIMNRFKRNESEKH